MTEYTPEEMHAMTMQLHKLTSQITALENRQNHSSHIDDLSEEKHLALTAEIRDIHETLCMLEAGGGIWSGFKKAVTNTYHATKEVANKASRNVTKFAKGESLDTVIAALNAHIQMKRTRVKLVHINKINNRKMVVMFLSVRGNKTMKEFDIEDTANGVITCDITENIGEKAIEQDYHSWDELKRMLKSEIDRHYLYNGPPPQAPSRSVSPSPSPTDSRRGSSESMRDFDQYEQMVRASKVPPNNLPPTLIRPPPIAPPMPGKKTASNRSFNFGNDEELLKKLEERKNKYPDHLRSKFYNYY